MTIRNAVLIACAGALCVTGGAAPVAMLSTASAQSEAARVDVSIVDRRGRRVQMRALPERDRAQVERLQDSVRSFTQQQAAFRRVGVTIRCTWPPLRCTITIVISAFAN